ncbi:hypothetical protein ACTMSW_18745 [Micromonospora sp. BQ11]|uniref:hypothetical protein n=1 Tax=Micromonospora sp. BQ11 TaxID=3452212 RepID=UPI003F886839
MTERPTAEWRRDLQEQEAAVAAGTLDPDSADAYALRLYPAAFTADVDAALTVFEHKVEQADLTSDGEVWGLIEGVVNGLNAVSERWELIETGEREELCQYIDDVLTAAGVDVSALASRRRIYRSDITDRWREW